MNRAFSQVSETVFSVKSKEPCHMVFQSDYGMLDHSMLMCHVRITFPSHSFFFFFFSSQASGVNASKDAGH